MNELTVVIAGAIGLLLPFLVTLIKQQGFPRWLNLIIALASSAAAGTITAWARGDFTGVTVAACIIAAITASQAAYAAYWRDSGVEGLNEVSSLIK